MKAIGIILAGGNNKLNERIIQKEGNRGNAGCGKLPQQLILH